MSAEQAIITLVAAVISGVLATIITIFINRYQELIRQKQDLVDDIFGFKYQLADSYNKEMNDIYSQGFCRAMNRVPIVFNKEESVLQAYDKFYDTLSISNPNERKMKSDEALMVFLREICKAAHIKCDNWSDSRFKRTFNLS